MILTERYTFIRNNNEDWAGFGQEFLGNASSTVTIYPQISGAFKTSLFCAGSFHACFVMNDSSINSYVLCMGRGDSAQLGDGKNESTSQFQNATLFNSVLQGKEVTSICCGHEHTCLTTNENQLYCAGSNEKFQVGDSIIGGFRELVHVSLNDVLKVKCGMFHTCLELSNSTVYCFGSNDYGQISGDGVLMNASPPISVNFATNLLQNFIHWDTGGDHVCGVLIDGSVSCWGRNDRGRCGRGVSCWWTIAIGQVNLPTQNNVTNVYVGTANTCFRFADSRYACIGYGANGACGVGNTIDRGCSATTTGNSLVYLPLNNISNLFTGVSAYHICANASNNIYCWGSGRSGQLTVGRITDSTLPILVDMNIFGNTTSTSPVTTSSVQTTYIPTANSVQTTYTPTIIQESRILNRTNIPSDVPNNSIEVSISIIIIVVICIFSLIILFIRRRRHVPIESQVQYDVPLRNTKRNRDISERSRSSSYSNTGRDRRSSKYVHPSNVTHQSNYFIPQDTPISKVMYDLPPSRPKSAQVDDRWYIDNEEIKREKKIGKGTFGEVYRAVWRGGIVAVKEVIVNNDREISSLISECEALSKLRPHPNVCGFYGVVRRPKLALVLEFCSGGSLDAVLYGTSRRTLPLEIKLHLVIEIASGVSHLHAEQIVHRDLAARNVLLDANMMAKVTDFGMSRHGNNANSYTSTRIGPLKWMAPEQLERSAFSTKSDVFSFAVLLYEIYEETEPWSEIKPIEAAQRVLSGERLPCPKSMPKHISDHVFSPCFSPNIDERPTMLSILSVLVNN